MYPNDEQWAIFQRYQNCPLPMHPRTFLQHWELDYPDIARLTGVSRHTVSHWFSSGRGGRPAPEAHQRRLATIHFLWSNSDRIPIDLLDQWCELTDDKHE
jgi:hypothetical protein